MHFHHLPSFLLFLMFIIIILISVPLCLCVDDVRYTNCSQPFNCGGIENVTYPFWGGNRPVYCGQPGFELQCLDDVPKITMMQDEFRVIEIDNNTRTLKVARDDYWETICPEYFYNTTLNFTLFNYASGLRNLTILYNCSGLFTGLPSPVDCTINGTDINAYYVASSTAVEPLIGVCSSNVKIPLFEATAQALEDGTIGLFDALDDGFELLWNSNIACSACTSSGGNCGYSKTTNQFTCFCPDHPSNSICATRSSGSSQWKRNVFIIAISFSVGTMAALIAVICAPRRKLFPHLMMMFKKNRGPDQIEAFIINYGTLTLKRYSYADVKRMTNSFTVKLGKGGYGTVYQGKLPDGRLVAMKVLTDSKGNGEEFINEVASISRTSHVNVVTLVGFCYEKAKRALIYEFMPNGSLDKFICDRDSSNTKPHLEWETLYQIAVGIARGLEYLHRGCNTRIVHFDIKPHNILLDENFCPKISDFGLAKLCKREESIVSMLGARGTIGYIAPEVFCRNFGRVSHKSDVYSYGMMVVEMVGGRKNFGGRVSETSEKYFPEWIYKQLEPGEDFKLHGVTTDEEEDIARKMIIVSMCCIQTNPPDRPSMTKVVEMLEGRLESLQIPPKPFLSSPPIPAQPSSMTSSSSNESSTLVEKNSREESCE